MTSLSIDLGFERGATANPANDDRPQLLAGLTRIGVIGNPLHLARDLRVNDDVRIAVYDLSESGQRLGVREMSFRIQFLPARAPQENPSPINAVLVDRFDIFQRPDPNRSTVWEQVAPTWDLANSPNAAPFPGSQLQGVAFVSEPVFTLRFPGAYYCTLELRVDWIDGLGAVYRVDPEMICTGEFTGAGGARTPA